MTSEELQLVHVDAKITDYQNSRRLKTSVNQLIS